MQSLVQQLRDEEAKAAREKAKAAAANPVTKIQIAEAFDAHNARLAASLVPRPLPWMVHPQRYASAPAVGWMSFKDVTFQQCAQMMRDYPSIAQVKWRDSQRRQSGISHPDFAKGDTRSSTDGFTLEVSQGIDFPASTQIKWMTTLDGLIIDLHVGLSRSSGMAPHIRARHREIGGVVVEVVGSTAEMYYPFGDTSGLRHQRYAQSGRTHYPHISVWGVPDEAGGGMMRYVDSVVAELERKAVESMAAYRRDKESGHLIAKVEPRRGFTSSAGSPGQDAALLTEAALRDRALAERHWWAYCQDSLPEEWVRPSTQSYFDHYAWACKWLLSVGLYEDQNFRTEDGKPYKYGARWVNADGTIIGE